MLKIWYLDSMASGSWIKNQSFRENSFSYYTPSQGSGWAGTPWSLQFPLGGWWRSFRRTLPTARSSSSAPPKKPQPGHQYTMRLSHCKNGNLRFRPDFHHYLVQFALLLLRHLLQCLTEDVGHPLPVWLRNVVGRRAGKRASNNLWFWSSPTTLVSKCGILSLFKLGMICCDEMSTGFVVSDGKYFLFNSLFNSMCKFKF